MEQTLQIIANGESKNYRNNLKIIIVIYFYIMYQNTNSALLLDTISPGIFDVTAHLHRGNGDNHLIELHC